MAVEVTGLLDVIGGPAPAWEALMLKLGIILAMVAYAGVGASPRAEAEAFKVQFFKTDPAPPPPPASMWRMGR